MPLRLGLAGVSKTTTWLSRLDVTIVDDRPDVCLWNPRHRRPDGHVVAFLPVEEDEWQVAHPLVMDMVGLHADAYAGDSQGVASALAWIARGAPKPTRGGVFLGGLGVADNGVPVGEVVPIEVRCMIGRSGDCDLCLRHGAHSDQNLCARHHAMLERVDGHLRLTDLGSTNGTYVDGAMIKAPTLVAAGQEVSFASAFRLQLCG